jgi:hypothetical protein
MRVEFESGELGAIPVLARIEYQLSFDRVLVDVILMVNEILGVANAVIGKTSLPNFPLTAKDFSQGAGISAFDELDGVLDRDVIGRSQQKMNMLRHQNEGVQLIASSATVAVHCFEKESGVAFDHKKSPALPGRKGYEISSGWGDESSRPQEQTSAAKAAWFA